MRDKILTKSVLEIDGRRETEKACVPVLRLRSPVIFIGIGGPPPVALVY
jgi:hypothetical protein